MTSPVGLQVISENALLKYGDDIVRHPVGTGPYQISAWQEGREIRLKPFQNYWDKQQKAPAVIFKYIAEQSERENALARGEVDILYTVSGYSIDRLKWLGKIDYYVQAAHNLLFLGFNHTRYPFNDARARRAVLRAINIPKLVLNVNRGNAEIAKGPLSAAYLKYDNVEQAGYDPDEARRLWRSVVKDSLIRVNFDFPGVAFARPTLVNILEEELGRLGIALNIRIHDTWEQFDEAISSEDAQLFINGGSPDFLGDAENFLNDLFSHTSDFNTLHYHNEQIEQWLQQSRRESDPEARRRLYEKIVRQVLEDTPAVFLYHVIPHFAYNVEKIKSMVVDPYGIIRFHKIELK
jgi:peptide/nickel transport system substrate-binding protein